MSRVDDRIMFAVLTAGGHTTSNCTWCWCTSCTCECDRQAKL